MADEDIYRDSLQRIIDDQIELEDETTVREQAEAADIELEDDNTVTDWDGTGEEAIERLKYQITGEQGSGDSGDGGDSDEDEDDRQEYYLETIRDIVDEQKQFLGDDVAIKQARQAPLIIDKDGNVEDFYGKGEDALEILRGFTEHQELYLKAIRAIVERLASFIGEKVTYQLAREAPLEITPDGDIKAYYGKGRNVLDLVIEKYEDYLGEEPARIQARNALRDTLDESQYELLPQRVRPSGDSEKRGLLQEIVDQLFGG